MEAGQEDYLTIVNGEQSQGISIHDRGLAFGDGLFETMRLHQGRIPLIDYHWARLQKGLLALRFQDVSSTIDRAKADLVSYIERLNPVDGVIKLVVTRGASQSGYGLPVAIPLPNIVISYRDAPVVPQHPVKVFWCEQRLCDQAGLAGIKHLNRLEYVLAAMELSKQEDCYEGLLQDRDGYLIEGTRSNVIIAIDGKLMTPKLDRCGVQGVMLSYLQDHFSIINAELTKDDVESAQEVILVGSNIGCVLVDDSHSDLKPTFYQAIHSHLNSILPYSF